VEWNKLKAGRTYLVHYPDDSEFHKNYNNSPIGSVGSEGAIKLFEALNDIQCLFQIKDNIT
jgi:hypothetical protein